MNVRLSEKDQEHVRTIQNHFAGLKPLGVKLTTTDVVRMALYETVKKANLCVSDTSDYTREKYHAADRTHN